MQQTSPLSNLDTSGGTQMQLLPDDFIMWQLQARQSMLESIGNGGLPRRHPAHLPILISFDADNPFSVRTATKGVGLTPHVRVLDDYVTLLEETLIRCDGRPWEETLPDRVAAVSALLQHPDDIDRQCLGSLEIFRGRTYANLHQDPRVILHFADDGPDYVSYQINARAEIVGLDDPRYRFIALSRQIFEEAPFHLHQPGYVAAYVIGVHEVLSKTPYVVSPSLSATSPTHGLTSPEPVLGFAPETEPVAADELSLANTMRSLMVPVDNSSYSAWSIDIALQLAQASGATVVGNHVYAARLHEQRFRDMEPGLPEPYQEATILEHQRELHGTLIGRGLQLIADSYLDILKQRCRHDNLQFVAKTPEGKNYAELVRDIESSSYDLVVMGARGMGETWRRGERRDTTLGSVCERVVRRVSRDVLVVKDERQLCGTYVVGIDGSPRGFGALRMALAIAATSGAKVQAVAAYDPFLHAVLFKKLEDALTEEARQVFNTEAQQKLHDELIDDGIAKLYRDHLDTAQRIAAELGCEIETQLLAGKAYEAVLRHVHDVKPSLVLLGRTGAHADDMLDIGSTAENLLRLVPCHVLLVGRTFTPTWAEVQEVIESLAWTPAALARLERVPSFVRGMVRKAIERHAREQGRSEVDEQIVLQARQRFGG